MTKHKLDRIDRHILDLLQKDARISVADIADRVGLSPTPCGRRIKRLEDEGLIDRQVVLLDQNQVGLPMTVLVLVSLDAQTREKLQAFEEAVASLPEVMECYLITGNTADYVIKVCVPDLEYYQQLLLDKLTALPNINSLVSNFVLRKPIGKTALPLDHLTTSG